MPFNFLYAFQRSFEVISALKDIKATPRKHIYFKAVLLTEECRQIRGRAREIIKLFKGWFMRNENKKHLIWLRENKRQASYEIIKEEHELCGVLSTLDGKKSEWSKWTSGEFCMATHTIERASEKAVFSGHTYSMSLWSLLKFLKIFPLIFQVIFFFLSVSDCGDKTWKCDSNIAEGLKNQEANKNEPQIYYGSYKPWFPSSANDF